MTQTRIARFAAVSVGAVAALSFAVTAGAATVSELQAQINALMAQLAAMQGGSTSVSTTYTTDLTVGSSGAQVVALQTVLESKGYLVMPAGVAKGYFGALTKAAVARWQAASGITPAAGYVGPKSRAALNAMGGSTTGGITTGGTTTGGSTGITTPGAEGTLTVTSSAVSASTIYEGDKNVPVLAFKAAASPTSDLAVQRVKVDLGSSSTLYRKLLTKVSLVDDAGRVLASADLNTSTVVRDSDDRYYVTLSGFTSIVSKGTNRIYTLKADALNSIDSSDISTGGTVRLAANGVRAQDGAGIDLYSPTAATDVTRTLTFSASLSDSTSLAVSTDANTPATQEVIAAAGSGENEADKVELLRFTIRAEKDDVTITDLKNFVITTTNANGSGASASSTFLYEGAGTSGTLLGTASVSTTDADFTDISSQIAKGTTKTYTLAADVRSASANQATISATFTGNTTNVVAENSVGDTVSTVSGSATGNSIYARNVGPVFSLVGAPTITRSSGTAQNNVSTSSATATFNVKVKAVGGDILFGNNASTTMPMFSNAGNAVNDSPSFLVYLNGAADTQALASTTDFAQPTSGVVSGSSNSFTLQEGQEVTVPVSFTVYGRLATSALVTAGSYAVDLSRINWVSPTGVASQSSFMTGKTEWRTSSVTMP